MIGPPDNVPIDQGTVGLLGRFARPEACRPYSRGAVMLRREPIAGLPSSLQLGRAKALRWGSREMPSVRRARSPANLLEATLDILGFFAPRLHRKE